MCYGICKYEYSFGLHELTGECSICNLLGIEDMPSDAECMREDEDIANEHISVN